MAFRCIGWNTGIYPEIGQLFGSLLTLPPQPLFPYSELKQNWGKARSNIYVRTGRLFWERWRIADLRDAWTPYSVLHFFFCSLHTHFLLPPPVHNRRKLNPREVAPPLGTFTRMKKEQLWLLKFIFQYEESLSVCLRSWDNYKASP